MPRHERKPAKIGPGHEKLVDALVGELRDPKPIGQPIVLEDHTPETDSIRINVVWDRWEECPREARSTIILDAYKRFFDKETFQQITLTLGTTVPEAVALGLLPFGIEPARSRAGDATQKEYCDAMTEAGASSVPGLDMPQLRFATREDAENGLEHLEQTLPNSRWILVINQDVSNSISFHDSASVSYPNDGTV